LCGIEPHRNHFDGIDYYFDWKRFLGLYFGWNNTNTNANSDSNPDSRPNTDSHPNPGQHYCD
jgi:hypothetical protein